MTTSIELTVFHLRFHDHPFHFAQARRDRSHSERFLHSDALYAALLHTLASQGQAPADPPPFFLSSAFPFFQPQTGKPPLYFFPKPLMSLPPGLTPPEHLTKKWKKVQWIEKSLLEKWLAGMDWSFDHCALNGPFLTPHTTPLPPLLLSEEQARVRVARLPQQHSEPFYIERLFMHPQAGLFFLAAAPQPQGLDLLHQALNALTHNGLGSFRSLGFGRFTVQKGQLTWQASDQAHHLYTLSLYVPPSPQDLQETLGHPSARYQLLRRSGWITDVALRNLRKKALWMIAEGSILRRPSQPLFHHQCLSVHGTTVDVSPLPPHHQPHPVYRHGIGFFLPALLQDKSSPQP